MLPLLLLQGPSGVPGYQGQAGAQVSVPSSSVFTTSGKFRGRSSLCPENNFCVCVCVCACARVQGVKGDSGPSGAVGAKGEPVLRMQKPMHSFFSMLDNICYSHVNIISKGFQGSPGFPGPPVCMELPPGPVYSHLCARRKDSCSSLTVWSPQGPPGVAGKTGRDGGPGLKGEKVWPKSHNLHLNGSLPVLTIGS